jgi:adenylate kinase
MNIALIGPPGAGKGTQAERLAAKFGFSCISTGDLFREHLKNNSELGTMIRKYWERGELVPDSITDATIEEWLNAADPQERILFDGYPRTLRQAKFLDKLFVEGGRRLDVVFYLKASDEELMRRLSERLICRECHTPFHKRFNPFTKCLYDKCKGEHLVLRDDDKPEQAQTRLKIFQQQIEPLIKFYGETDKVVTVDAERTIDQVSDLISQAITARWERQRQ